MNMFPDTIVINVTQDDLDSGGRRGERPDAIYLALKRDYPDFGVHMTPNGYVRLTHQDTDKIAWYPATVEYARLINEIDLTNGNPHRNQRLSR
jgi:hypothetical protein